MTKPLESSESQTPNYFRIAWQSALAAGLCLGLPIALMFWVLIVSKLVPSRSINSFLLLLQNTWYPLASENAPSTPQHDFLMKVQMHVTAPAIVLSLGILGWAYGVLKLQRILCCREHRTGTWLDPPKLESLPNICRNQRCDLRHRCDRYQSNFGDRRSASRAWKSRHAEAHSSWDNGCCHCGWNGPRSSLYSLLRATKN